MHTELFYAQELLRHQIPPGDLDKVFGGALKTLIRVGEKRKFAATGRPQRAIRRSANPRHIPNRVKREVWKHDGGHCTFVSEAGHQCEARTLIEYDHVRGSGARGQGDGGRDPAPLPGAQQYTAECTFGSEFMRNKHEEAQDVSAIRAEMSTSATPTACEEAKTSAGARQGAERAAAEAAERVGEQDVIPWLRGNAA